MSFSTYLNTKLNLAKESVMGLQSLKEYTTHLIANFEEVIAGTFQGTFSLPLPYGVNSEALFAISAEQVQQCMNEGVDTIQLYRGPDTDPVEFGVDVVNDALENLLSEAQVQKEFLNAMLESVSTTAASFATTVLTKYQSISSSIVDKYSQYLDAGDKLTALRQWISEKDQATLQTTNNAVIIYKKSDYVGESVWLLVLTDFGNAVNDAFDLVVKSVQDLLGVFEKIWEGIKNFGSWILRKAVLPLTTNFCEGNAKIGIVDMPIFQIKLGSISIAGNVNIDYELNYMLTNVLSNVGNNYKLANPYAPSNNNTYMDRDYSQRCIDLLSAVCNGNIGTDDPDIAVFRPIDILWTSEDTPANNLIFRLGPVANGSNYDVILQCFYACPNNFYGLYTDRQLYGLIKNAWYDFVVEMSHNFPYAPIPSQSNGTFFNAIRNQVITDLSSSESSSDGPLNLVQHMNYYKNSDVLNNTGKVTVSDVLNYGECFTAFIWYSILPWLYMNGRSGDSIVVSNGYIGHDDAYLLGRTSDYWTGWESYTIDNSIPNDWPLMYRPYVRDGLYGASLHCQTLAEQATELERYLLAAVIAVAAAFIAYKFSSVGKTIYAKTKLARGAADDYSWKHGVNPTSDDVKQYKKLNRVANRWERFSAFIGKLSPVHMMQSIKNRCTDNNESIGTSINDVYNVIRGM